MPELNGLDAVAAMRACESRQGLPHTLMIVVTANAMESDIERARAAGFDEFLSKPVQREALRRVVYGFQ